MFYNPHDPVNMDRLLELTYEDQTGIDGRPSIEEALKDEPEVVLLARLVVDEFIKNS